MKDDPTAGQLIRAAMRLRERLDAMPLEGADILRGGFGLLEYLYNPLDYAWELHRAYLERFGRGPGRRLVLVGLNPGPWGMGQTGVPFGDPQWVREWMDLSGSVSQPRKVCPGRAVLGLESRRREESGNTLWSWARDRFGSAEDFFSVCFVANWCPLLMFDSTGRNVTPSDFRSGTWQLARLQEACDEALAGVLRALGPEFVVGLGKFAARRAQAVLQAAGQAGTLGCIVHPSPQTRGRWGPGGWAGLADAELRRLGALPEPPVSGRS